jgi:DNA-binding NarL/FixJ family response regulator
MKRYKILVADDHPIVRDGLRHILEKDFDVVGSVGDGRTLLKEAKRLNPDIVLVDISMPIVNGIEATRQISQSSLQTKVVVLTMYSDVTYASEVFEAGASGYVLKNAGSEEIRTAIHEAIAGKKYVTPQIARDVRFVQPGSNSGGKRANQLTTRQREVLQLLAEGRTGKEIADVLCVSPRTVEFHKYNIMEELGLRTTAELTRYAIRHGFISAV